MADKTIDDLSTATDIYPTDKFLLQQSGVAKSLAASKLTEFVTRDVVDIEVETVDYDAIPVSTYDEATHTLNMQVQRGPGIEDIQKTATVGKVDTYTITTQDNQSFNFDVTNGDGLVNSVMGISPPTGSYDVSKASLLNIIYPVGSIYMSTVSTSPATLFGFGTWAAIEGRFLVGVDGDEYASAGATGGEATHTLTLDEVPSHNHSSGNTSSTTGNIGMYDTSGTNYAYNLNWSTRSNRTDLAIAVKSEGGGQPHENRPPYYAVYMWRRTA